MPVNSDSFKQALGRFASGVTIVTTADGERLSGLTVSAFSSVSLDPPLVLVCINKQSSAVDTLRSGRVFAVNFLSDEQIALSNHFASRTTDKFSDTAYHLGTLGVPILQGCLAHLEGSLVQEIDAGDHYVYIGQVEATEFDDTKQPLLYYHGRYETLHPAPSLS
ncbi:MAG: hypothetical protein A2201_00125 [Alicyclobacillus sp. RIFOXYA1_FULL_53_8]|nr:MAG: hypothetical protein A2201_00125 [Alicyclobacillus sp. RIFOXYA1_FULL_53_8]